jgi:hypothetical protein
MFQTDVLKCQLCAFKKLLRDYPFLRHVTNIKWGGIYHHIPHFEGAAYNDEVHRGPRSETQNWSATYVESADD